MLQYLPITLTILAFLLTIARPISPVLAPWLGKWQWCPPAVVLFMAFLSGRLVGILGAPPVFSADTEATLQVVDSVVQALVGLAQAYQQGHGLPSQTSTPDLTRTLPGALLMLGILALSGCQGTFEEARIAGLRHQKELGATPSSHERCVTLSDREAFAGGVAKGLALSGAALAVTAAAIKEDNAKIWLELGAGGLGAGAGTALFISDSAGKAYGHEMCAVSTALPAQ